MKNFIEFVREQGVVGLAVGFILGGAISKVVTALVNDIINPLLSVLIGAAGNFKDSYIPIGASKIMWGDFVSVTVDFIIVTLVVYIGVKKLGLDRLDKKK